MGFLQMIFWPLSLFLKVVEQLLFMLINWYDAYCYSPLQSALSPVVARVPRWAFIGGHRIPVFTANIVSWARTALVIPIAYCLKYDYPLAGFLCVIFHDFLDHLDGIVAKVHKSIFGQIDDPLLGGFMDAFCDKIVNCVSLWTILVVTDFSNMTFQQTWLFLGACVVIISYEFVLGVVRVQDYFQAYYSRKYKAQKTESTPNLAAVMEGKLKEKLESLGIGCLCLAQAHSNVMNSTAGLIGVLCLLLSVRLAHASLMHKLKPRQESPESETSNQNDKNCQTNKETENRKTSEYSSQQKEKKKDEKSQSDDEEDEKPDFSEKKPVVKTKRSTSLPRAHSVPSWKLEVSKVDKVYTVGCFDLFHDGHKILLERLSTLGRQVIVGVHDSRSIFKLKKKVPIDSTTKRMSNVKKHASITFCIRGTDPTPFLKCMYDADEDCTSMYVRGDDMPEFPARKFIESVMPVHFLPYTENVSSTKIRKEVYNASMFGPHVANDESHDHAMFY